MTLIANRIDTGVNIVTYVGYTCKSQNKGDLMSSGDRKAVEALWQLTQSVELVERVGVEVGGSQPGRLVQAAVAQSLAGSEVNKRPNGRAQARSDSGAPFMLPPALDDFLRIIRAEHRREKGRFVGWCDVAKEGF
jgi:hypothetical protein